MENIKCLLEQESTSRQVATRAPDDVYADTMLGPITEGQLGELAQRQVALARNRNSEDTSV